MPKKKQTESKGTDVQIQLTEPQAEFYQLQCKFPLFKGGYGTGKSHTMTVCAFTDANHSANALIGIYEPNFPLIKDIAVPRMEQLLIDHGIRYTYNKKDHDLFTSNSGIGDFVFRSMDNPELIVGYETYRSHIDELDVLPEEKSRTAWLKILGRNRQWPKGLQKDYMRYNSNRMRHEPFNRVSAYSTPEGYRFTYKTWGMNQIINPDGTIDWKNPHYQFVTASTYSNPFNPEDYIESLKSSYPSNLLEAYLEGKWVNLASGSVYSNYDRTTHASNETIRKGEPLYIGVDFNVRNISATIWVKRHGGSQWHAVGQLTGVFDTPELIRMLEQKYVSEGHDITIYPDASKPTNTTNASVTDIALLQAAGFKIRAREKNPFVRDRVAATQKAFADGKLFVNEKEAPSVADCFNQQCWNKNGEPDKEAGFDHQNDASTYPIAYEFPVRKPIFALPVSWAV